MKKKILTFGTFDIFHPGHEFFLKEAKTHGEVLSVVVARDSTVEKVKGRPTTNNELARLAVIKALDYVDDAVLGNQGDKYAIIEELKPDIIFLGYDQHSFTENLAAVLAERGLSPQIIKSDKSLKPEVYKSSRLRS